ncbi:hypothetical protein DFJ73DRAFT_840477 [Zopfochytrium polystomum]|nr:hypothetical protein DFJ73DRAFT_840477 [Zopfochytrium polystomum]
MPATYHVNREIGKFFIYIMFPIGSLYLFNRPDVHVKLFGAGPEQVARETSVPEDQMVKNVPKTHEALREQLDKMRKRRAESLDSTK